ncbi:DNA primase, partial [Pectobacterium aquaticum]
MARIPESELQHLKAAVSLVEVVRAQGRKVVKRGKDVVVLCPFHQEKTPSMVISPDKNLYHCFGCDAGGSVIDWVMKTEGLSLPHAVDKLRRELGSVPAAEPLPPVADIANEQEQQALLHRVTEFYHH